MLNLKCVLSYFLGVLFNKTPALESLKGKKCICIERGSTKIQDNLEQKFYFCARLTNMIAIVPKTILGNHIPSQTGIL